MNAVRILAKSVRRILPAVVVFVTLASTMAASAEGGTLDPAFGVDGAVIADFGSAADAGNAVILQPDGKILMAGFRQEGEYPFQRAPIIVRYHSDGSVDSAFGVNGQLALGMGLHSPVRLALQSDGKLLAAGSSGGALFLARYDGNGISLDSTFGTGGIVTYPMEFCDVCGITVNDVAVQPDGKIVLVGTESIGNYTFMMVFRFNPNGSLDETFVANGFTIIEFPDNRYAYGRAVAIQPDGKIVVSGDMMDNEAEFHIALARLNSNGFLDTTFGVNGMAAVPLTYFESASGALALQPNGKIVVAGTFADRHDENHDLVAARFNSNGSLDTAFGGSGVVVANLGYEESAKDLAVQGDGKIVVVGEVSGLDFKDALLVRYNADGSLDSAFGVNGVVTTDFDGAADSASEVVLQLDGGIVIAGASGGDALLARYLSGPLDVTTYTVTFKSIPTVDGWILESAENSNTGGSLNKLGSVFFVGDDVRDRQYRGILSFNTISLPDNAVITSTRLDIRRQGVVGTSPFATHGDLLADIRAGAFSNNLALQLTDFNAAASPGSNWERFTPLDAVWYAAQMSQNNLRFVNKFGVTQFRLYFALDDNDDMGTDYVKFFSGEALEAYRPKLIVTYYLPK